MDTSYTFSTLKGIRAMLYVAPEFDAPFELELALNGQPVKFLRVSDRSLECGPVASRVTVQGESVPISGVCKSPDCHRKQLGDCQCGRHEAPVRFTRATQ